MVRRSDIRVMQRGHRAGKYPVDVLERIAKDTFAILFAFGLGDGDRIDLKRLILYLEKIPTWKDQPREKIEDMVLMAVKEGVRGIRLDGQLVHM